MISFKLSQFTISTSTNTVPRSDMIFASCFIITYQRYCAAFLVKNNVKVKKDYLKSFNREHLY